MRLFWGVLAVLALVGPAQAADWRGPMDCKDSNFEPNITVCHTPALLKEDAAVADEYKEIRDTLTGRDLNVFMAGQSAWNVNQATDCRAQNAANYSGGIAGCVKATLDERLAFFRTLRADPLALIATAARYDSIQPWYIRLFAKQYEGREVYVDATPILAGCHVPAGMQMDGGFAIKIEFEKISHKDASRLCNKQPIAWWKGVVKLDPSGKVYLHVRDLSDVNFFTP